jgi:hypothetical protein
VKDEDVGIEPEYLPRIFNEVLQINPNKNQGGKGAGMGLLNHQQRHRGAAWGQSGGTLGRTRSGQLLQGAAAAPSRAGSIPSSSFHSGCGHHYWSSKRSSAERESC